MGPEEAGSDQEPELYQVQIILWAGQRLILLFRVSGLCVNMSNLDI